MNRSRQDLAITILQWVMGVIVFVESCLTFRGALLDLHAAEHIHHLELARLFISGCEAIAAVLFLIPGTLRVGGWILIVIFAWAILLHSWHGYVHELPLVIYGAGVFAVMTFRGKGK
jgi:uncharacterized membrane protein YphA (DoxX/SURF4 family)